MARRLLAGSTDLSTNPSPATSSGQQVPRRALVLLAVLTLVWGTNWPLFPIAVREVSVWTFRSVSLLSSGLLLLAVARLRGDPLAIPRRHWGTLAAATCAYLLIWPITTTYAATMIPSGQAAVLGFTMPLWSALISRFVLGERLKPRMLVALALGAAAVGLLMMRNIGVYAEAPLGLVMGLTAGLGWAIGTLVLKRRPIGAPALVLTGWQSLLAGVPISVAAIALGEGPAFMPSLTTIAVIGYIILVPMCIGNFCWFSIVGLLPANLAGLSSVLVPVVAMISGAIVLGEPLGPLQWLAMICIATALSLALLRPERT